ncbi:MAG: CDP-diacylglycerol--glycerol-3-phosphate 3-phosphatidyltransferase [Shimia sp.]
MVWTLPNLLTGIRLLAAPLVIVAFWLLPRPLADWVALVLFVGAALTDWLDGYLARAWKQVSPLGAMLDPIADKAMVLIALLVIVALFGANMWVLVPAGAIVFREVFVSGLREYLGQASSGLQVTRLAKWKTTVQMVAIVVLLAKGVVEHGLYDRIVGMDPALVEAVLAGEVEDVVGLRWREGAVEALRWGGIAGLWVAAGLTLVTGWEYFRKALPLVMEARR